MIVRAAPVWQTRYYRKHDVQAEVVMLMQLGSRGPLVLSWQRFLVARELLVAAVLDGPDAGYFSAETAAATSEYQRRSAIDVDGLAGEQTLERAQKDGYTGVAELPEYLLLYGLSSGACDGWDHPTALVHAPPGFDPRELAVVVYLHGINNNIENVVRSAPLDASYPVADLLGQLGRSQRNALLIVPELRYNFGSPDPGRLGEAGALQRLLGEVLAKLPPPLAGLTVDDIRQLVVISHSGGYRAAGVMALGGGVRVDELYLLDSLYGLCDEVCAFAGEVLSAAATAPAQRPTRRLINLYLSGGKTAEHSRTLGRHAAAELSRHTLPAETVVIADEPLVPEAVPPGAAVVSQRVTIAHSDLPARFVGALLQQSGLPRRR